MSDKKQEKFEIIPEAVPTENGMLEKAAYANAVKIVGGVDGFLIYFFHVPPDVLELPEVGEILEESPPTPENPKLQLPLDPAAKVFILPDLVPSLIEVMSETYKTWVSHYKTGKRPVVKTTGTAPTENED